MYCTTAGWLPFCSWDAIDRIFFPAEEYFSKPLLRWVDGGKPEIFVLTNLVHCSMFMQFLSISNVRSSHISIMRA